MTIKSCYHIAVQGIRHRRFIQTQERSASNCTDSKLNSDPDHRKDRARVFGQRSRSKQELNQNSVSKKERVKTRGRRYQRKHGRVCDLRGSRVAFMIEGGNNNKSLDRYIERS